MGFRIVNRAQVIGLILVFVLVAVAVLLQASKVLVNLNLMSVTVEKVVVAGRLHNYVLKQSDALKGYILYQKPAYLEEFRRYAGLSRQEIEELQQVVRP